MSIQKVFFFCYPHGPANRSGYEHQIVCLAEGLTSLGIKISGNVNYWRKSLTPDDYLIFQEPFDPGNYDLVVFSSNILSYQSVHLLPDDLFKRDRKYRIAFIDSADGLATFGELAIFREADIVLKSHFNKKERYPKNFTPWQFGLTNRIIEALKNKPSVEKTSDILINHRSRHEIRDLAEFALAPIIQERFAINYDTESFLVPEMSDIDYLNWKQTGRRHYPSFYKRLSLSAGCACFSGFWNIEPINYKSALSRITNIPDFDRIHQFDSWRFWEALAAGCCPFHVDFNIYGCVFPVMPQNGHEYLGVNFKSIGQFKKTLKEPNQIIDISEIGKEWVIENYSPPIIAERLLSLFDC